MNLMVLAYFWQEELFTEERIVIQYHSKNTPSVSSAFLGRSSIKLEYWG